MIGESQPLFRMLSSQSLLPHILAACWACFLPTTTATFLGRSLSRPPASVSPESDQGGRPAAGHALSSSLVQLQLGSALVHKGAQPSLWGTLCLGIFSALRSALEHKFMCIVLVLAALAILCFLPRGYGRGRTTAKCKWPNRMDPDWDTALEKSLATCEIERSPSCKSLVTSELYRPYCGSLSELPLSTACVVSDPQLSPRAESFTSCQDHGGAESGPGSDGALTPRSHASFADCEEAESLLLSRPAPGTDQEKEGEDCMGFPWRQGSYGSFK